MMIFDISLTISADLPTWPGDPLIHLERISKIEQGEEANVTRMDMCVHVGTHVDAPYHFLGGQTPTVESLSLETLTGEAYVIQVPDQVESINAEVLEAAQIPTQAKRVLFKTRNSQKWVQGETTFDRNFVAITLNGAEYLVNFGVQLVGVDYLSVAPFDEPSPTHRCLLQSGIVIVEGLNLSQVPPGVYTLYCLPLKIAGADGAPARAILVCG